MAKKIIQKNCQLELLGLGFEHEEECMSCHSKTTDSFDCYLGQWIDGVGWLCGGCWNLTAEFIQAGCRL